jgi:hypothetical protein
MTDRTKLKDRARDELFSHINRCGVLQAEAADQKHWMDETMDYLAERYPDLSDAELKELYNVGIRFCQPAIARGRSADVGASKSEAEATDDDATGAEDAEIHSVDEQVAVTA